MSESASNRCNITIYNGYVKSKVTCNPNSGRITITWDNSEKDQKRQPSNEWTNQTTSHIFNSNLIGLKEP